MSLPKVYLESSVISYLTARPSRDVLKLAKQEVTRGWWEKCRNRFEVYTSQIVVNEITKGDFRAAEARLLAVGDIPLLTVTGSVIRLADMLVLGGAVPVEATNDAMHIAISAVHGMDYLLTWNCAHINNPRQREKINAVVERKSYRVVVISTPDELR